MQKPSRVDPGSFVIFTAMTFEEYLTGKHIDGAAFRQGDLELYTSLSDEFRVMHPNSFTIQKLHLINPLRRKYMLKTPPPAAKDEHVKPPVPRPKPIMPKPRIG